MFPHFARNLLILSAATLVAGFVLSGPGSNDHRPTQTNTTGLSLASITLAPVASTAQAAPISQATDHLIPITQAAPDSNNPFFGRGDEDKLRNAVGAQAGSLAAGSDDPINYIKTLVATVANWLLSILATVSVLAMVYAGFLWVTARGVPDQIGKAKQIIGYAIAGLLLAFFSFAIVTAITRLPQQGGVQQDAGGGGAAPGGGGGAAGGGDPGPASAGGGGTAPAGDSGPTPAGGTEPGDPGPEPDRTGDPGPEPASRGLMDAIMPNG